MFGWIKKLFPKKQYIIKTELESGYNDTDEILLYGVMACLVDFIENYKPWMENSLLNNESIDLSEEDMEICKKQIEAAHEAVEIYKWWKDYPNKLNEINDLYEMSSWKAYKREEALYNEATDMLIRLMKIRDNLWT